jgi:AraC family transcriptional regulator
VGYAEHLQKAIDYIEEHVRDPITVDECAAAAGYSRYHFHRLFVVYVGLPVMTYVRRRRLAHAVQELSRGVRILDVALDFGYGSERAFSRACVHEYGQTPGRLRGRNFVLSRKPCLVEREFGRNEGIQVFGEVRYENLEDMRVASLVVVSRNPEEEVIEQLSRWADMNGIETSARRFGFDIPVSEEEQKQGMRGYEYWVCVPEQITESDGVVIKQIEGCRYAVLRIADPFADAFYRIPQGWQRLVAWVTSNVTQDGGHCGRYCLEEVREEAGVTYMDLFLPVS